MGLLRLMRCFDNLLAGKSLGYYSKTTGLGVTGLNLAEKATYMSLHQGLYCQNGSCSLIIRRLGTVIPAFRQVIRVVCTYTQDAFFAEMI